VIKLLEDREKSHHTFLQEAAAMLSSLFRYSIPPPCSPPSSSTA